MQPSRDSIDKDYRTQSPNLSSKMKTFKSTAQSMGSSIDTGRITAKNEEVHYIDLQSAHNSIRAARFLMDNCPLISVPDLLFLSVLFELEAPVVTKAAYILECIDFVHKCSAGQWPAWTQMGSQRISVVSFPTTKKKSVEMNVRRTFLLWADVIAIQLDATFDKEDNEENRSKYWSTSTMNDLYIESFTNDSTTKCPYGLRMLAALLLLEITIYIRESNLLTSQRAHVPPFRRQRMSRALERKTRGSIFSFQSSSASNVEPLVIDERNDSCTSTIGPDEVDKYSARKTSAKQRQSSILLNRRHTSRELSRNMSVKCRGSVHSDDIGQSASRTGSSLNEENNPTARATQEENESKKSLSWLYVIVRLLGSTNVVCEHGENCAYNCFDRQSESSWLLVRAAYRLCRESNLNILKSQTSLSEEQEFLQNIVDRQNKRISSLLSYRCAPGVAKDVDHVQSKRTETFAMKYANTVFSDYFQARTLAHVPLMTLCKNSGPLDENSFNGVLYTTWELLLDGNAELSATAATVFILAAAKSPVIVEQLLLREFENPSALIRYNAVCRFHVLWSQRYQFWMRVEEGAQAFYKILPPAIDFAMPSPQIGNPLVHMIDPCWLPRSRNRVEEVAVSQDEVRAVVTASKSRKKHQQENLRKALHREEITRRVARENFVISNVALLQSASSETIMHYTKSAQSAAANVAGGLVSAGGGGGGGGGGGAGGGGGTGGQVTSDAVEDEQLEDEKMMFEETVQVAQPAFPASLGRAVISLVNLLEDEEEICKNGSTVSELARSIVWSCLVEDPHLFSRFFMEKVTHRDRTKKAMQTVKKLFIHFISIPPQAAYIFFNCLLGLLMNFVRTPAEGYADCVNATLSLLWMCMPHVKNFSWKDFKQLLRKEQCELSILITASVPTTKKVIVNGLDMSQIPTQIMVQDDMKFNTVLQESRVFFGIPDSKKDKCHLTDNKTGQIMLPETYVRDFYFFKRNIYPQLSLRNIATKEAYKKMEVVAFSIKIGEISKVLLINNILSAIPNDQIRILSSIIFDDLFKCPSFPRKPLESDYDMSFKVMKQELMNLDVSHKICWIKLLTMVLFNMDPATLTIYDISIHINVVSGSLLTHSENYALIRLIMATYINLARYFKHIFEINGYMLILPALLAIYASTQSNKSLCQAVEFTCKQFYILHRIPFILQLFGSLSSLLDSDDQNMFDPITREGADTICKLLLSFEKELVDRWDILQLMVLDKNITSLDFCYSEDDNQFNALASINICVTVIAFAPSAARSVQILGILDYILPCLLKHLKNRTYQRPSIANAKKEIADLQTIMVSMITLVTAGETLSSRGFVNLKHENPVYHRGPKKSNHSPSFAIEDESVRLDDTTRQKIRGMDDGMDIGQELRLPRDRILSIVSTYVKWTTNRYDEIYKLLNDRTFRLPEVLDFKSHNRLAEMAQFLLKLGAHEHQALACKGLQSYFQDLCPATDWRENEIRPSFLNLLRRVDRCFSKSTKRPVIKLNFVKRNVNFDAMAGILTGLFSTLGKFPSLAHYSQVRNVVTNCILLVLNEGTTIEPPPAHDQSFRCAVIKLSGRYLHLLRETPNLEPMVNGALLASNNSVLNLYIQFLIPLLFWAVSNRKDAPFFNTQDVHFILGSVLEVIRPQSKVPSALSVQRQHLTVGEALLSTNITQKTTKQAKEHLFRTALLALKIIITGYSQYLEKDWTRLSNSIKLLFTRQMQGVPIDSVLAFVEFIIFTRNPLFLFMRTSLQYMIQTFGMDGSIDIERLKMLESRLEGNSKVKFVNRSVVLSSLKDELKRIKQSIGTRL
ncbi:hypothetical protein ACOME3_002163 [Neoechinorhynchus agilis]